MYCQNCGTTLETGTVFCGNCGAKQVVAASAAEQPSASTVIAQGQPNPQVEQVKSFFKNNLGKVIKSILSEPIKGTLEIFSNAKAEAYQHALILLITTGLFYTFIPYLFAGRERQFIQFSVFMKLGIGILITLMLISVLTFFIKSILGKSDFKKELLTGGMCGIPLMIFLSLFSILSLFGDSYSYFNMSFQSLINGSVFVIVITVYLLLFLFNIVQQSLKSSDSNDALSWYISPVVVCLALYLGSKISVAIFS